MGFRLVPKSVTLNDLERRNGHYFALGGEKKRKDGKGEMSIGGTCSVASRG